MNIGVRPFANIEDAISSTTDKKIVTTRKFVKKRYVHKHGSDSKVDNVWIAYKNCRGWIEE